MNEKEVKQLNDLWRMYFIVKNAPYNPDDYDRDSFNCMDMSFLIYKELDKNNIVCVLSYGARSDRHAHMWVTVEVGGMTWEVESTSKTIKRYGKISKRYTEIVRTFQSIREVEDVAVQWDWGDSVLERIKEEIS